MYILKGSNLGSKHIFIDGDQPNYVIENWRWLKYQYVKIIKGNANSCHFYFPTDPILNDSICYKCSNRFVRSLGFNITMQDLFNITPKEKNRKVAFKWYIVIQFWIDI